jgi:hypothetical protein
MPVPERRSRSRTSYRQIAMDLTESAGVQNEATLLRGIDSQQRRIETAGCGTSALVDAHPDSELTLPHPPPGRSSPSRRTGASRGRDIRQGLKESYGMPATRW